MCGAEAKPARGVGLKNGGGHKPLKRSRPNPIGKAKKRRKGKELDVFLDIWLERERTCVNCQTEIRNFHPMHFHHLHTKGARPDLRLDKNNIVLVCSACHRLAHDKGNDALALSDDVQEYYDTV